MKESKKQITKFILALMERFEINFPDLERQFHEEVFNHMMETNPDEAAWLKTQKLGKEGRK